MASKKQKKWAQELWLAKKREKNAKKMGSEKRLKLGFKKGSKHMCWNPFCHYGVLGVGFKSFKNRIGPLNRALQA